MHHDKYYINFFLGNTMLQLALFGLNSDLKSDLTFISSFVKKEYLCKKSNAIPNRGRTSYLMNSKNLISHSIFLPLLMLLTF